MLTLVSVGRSLSVDDNVGGEGLQGRAGQVQDGILSKNQRSRSRQGSRRVNEAISMNGEGSLVLEGSIRASVEEDFTCRC